MQQIIDPPKKRYFILAFFVFIIITSLLVFGFRNSLKKDVLNQQQPDTVKLSTKEILKNVYSPHPGSNGSVVYYSGSCISVLKNLSTPQTECLSPPIIDYGLEDFSVGSSSAIFVVQSTGEDDQVEKLQLIDFNNKSMVQVPTNGLIAVSGVVVGSTPGEHLILAYSEHESYEGEGPIIINQVGERIYSFSKKYRRLIDFSEGRAVLEEPKENDKELSYAVFNISNNQEELSEISSQTTPVIFQDKIFYVEPLKKATKSEEGHGGDSTGRLVYYSFSDKKKETLIDNLRAPSIELDKLNERLVIESLQEDNNPENPQYNSIIFNLKDGGLKKTELRYRPGLSTTHQLLFLEDIPVLSLSNGMLYELLDDEDSQLVGIIAQPQAPNPLNGKVSEDISYTYNPDSQSIVFSHPYMIWPGEDYDSQINNFFNEKGLNPSRVKTTIKSEVF